MRRGFCIHEKARIDGGQKLVRLRLRRLPRHLRRAGACDRLRADAALRRTDRHPPQVQPRGSKRREVFPYPCRIHPRRPEALRRCPRKRCTANADIRRQHSPFCIRRRTQRPEERIPQLGCGERSRQFLLLRLRRTFGHSKCKRQILPSYAQEFLVHTEGKSLCLRGVCAAIFRNMGFRYHPRPSHILGSRKANKRDSIRRYVDACRFARLPTQTRTSAAKHSDLPSSP